MSVDQTIATETEQSTDLDTAEFLKDHKEFDAKPQYRKVLEFTVRSCVEGGDYQLRQQFEHTFGRKDKLGCDYCLSTYRRIIRKIE